MKTVSFLKIIAVIGFLLTCGLGIGANASLIPLPQADSAQSSPQSDLSRPAKDNASGNRGQGMRGMGGLPGGARGMLGTVTEVAADHYTIKTDSGEIYTVHFSANTRIMKQPPGQGGGPGGRQAGSRRQNGSSAGGETSASPESGSADTNAQDRERVPPQTIKSSDIKVGDILTAAGELDASSKSIGAMFIAQIDPERAKQMREMQANYGKTWLAGRITAVDGTRITIDGMIDHASHAIEVDENTSFRQRRDSITLADIKPGEQLRAEGTLKSGVFLATVVNAMTPQKREAAQP